MRRRRERTDGVNEHRTLISRSLDSSARWGEAPNEPIDGSRSWRRRVRFRRWKAPGTRPFARRVHTRRRSFGYSRRILGTGRSGGTWRRPRARVSRAAAADGGGTRQIRDCPWPCGFQDFSLTVILNRFRVFCMSKISRNHI